MKARVKNFDVEVEPMTKYEFYDRIKKFSYNILKINESKVIILTEMDINSG